MLYARWRFQGLDPFVALHGPGVEGAPWPSRHTAVMIGFAMHAAEAEGAAGEFVKAFADMGSQGA